MKFMLKIVLSAGIGVATFILFDIPPITAGAVSIVAYFGIAILLSIVREELKG